MLGRRTRQWLGLGVLTVLLALGAYLVWTRARGGAASGHVTYAWVERPNVIADLYAPPKATERGPLVVLLQGNEPSQPDERLAIAAKVGKSLQPQGVSMAAVSFNIQTGYTLRACAADVAAVLHEVTGARNPTRLVLVGRGLGAWMASLLTLDRRLLEGAGMDPKQVDGVLLLRGRIGYSRAIPLGTELAQMPLAASHRASVASSSSLSAMALQPRHTLASASG